MLGALILGGPRDQAANAKGLKLRAINAERLIRCRLNPPPEDQYCVETALVQVEPRKGRETEGLGFEV